jgi:hypothetical protein
MTRIVERWAERTEAPFSTRVRLGARVHAVDPGIGLRANAEQDPG